jgi:hypothetical protein
MRRYVPAAGRDQIPEALGLPENSVRRPLNLRHDAPLSIIDNALAKMKTELPIDLPKLYSASRSK